MRKFLLLSLILIAVISSTALGDTIHLKNGSVLKGKVTSFADDQFIVMLDTGSGRYLSRAMVYIGDVAKIEFDAGSASPGDTTSTAIQPAEASPRIINDPPRREVNTRAADPRDARAQPAEPRETGPPETQTAPPPVRDPEPTQPEKPTASSTVPPASETSDTEKPIRKPSGPVRTMTIDVIAKKDWTSSQLPVKRGDRIRITASGNVTLNTATGRTSGPEGLPDLPDSKRLMPEQPSGSLIGVIGADNDDFIFIGRSAEFNARRDGLLFLSVNEGTIDDNAGAFKVIVEVQTTPQKLSK